MTRSAKKPAALIDADATPAGYLRDAQGHLIPLRMIGPVDRQRDKLVTRIVKEAKREHDRLVAFKTKTFADIAKLVEATYSSHGVRARGSKGNVTLYSFDGRYKVIRAFQQHVRFDENLQAAKKKVDDCVMRWSKNANDALKVLVQQAFQPDSDANVSVMQILALRRYKIDDPKWKEAMDAIGKAMHIVGSKGYIRVYERVGESERWEPISLDVAGV